MQIFPIYIRKEVVPDARYSISEWRLMRGRACAFVRPHLGRLQTGKTKMAHAKAYERISYLIVIDDSFTQH